ncbi:homologous recombination OB-fold protein [Perognathus longimembris pacificus]|uniref:homologous recombination OB-fold protein n=1 Tax=Perognathus longimembris pacificus TaxID=214514 RepID=UPI0020187C9A|nr:homologous recombination OB-fold protein [Perognathus longimembris pacificus]
MACSLQKLFVVEEEFEDEDFLSAVENAENQFVGALPMNAGRLRPVSSRPQEATQALRPVPLHPPTPQSLPPLGVCLATSSVPRTITDPSSTGTVPLRPVSTSSCWTGNQRMTLPEGLQESAPLPSPHSVRTSERHQQDMGGFEGPEQDDFDKVLASMELEGAGVGLKRGVSSEITQTLPARQQEDPVLTKKARRADPSGTCQKGPVPATHTAGVGSVQDEPLQLPGHHRSPWSRLRPGAVGSPPAPPDSAVPTWQPPWEVCPTGPSVPAPQPLEAVGGPIQNSPQNRMPSPPCQSPSAWFHGKPHFSGPQTPNSSCSTPSKTSSAVLSRGPLPFRAPVSSVESPVVTPKGPRSSLVSQATVQTPRVTNHLVQLVTAASRTPPQSTRPSARAKTRRFPGPAGVLPHQHSGKNLEEIMVSTPQTPTHGARAKFQTEVVASSQASVEEDFGQGPWLTMKSALGLDENDPTCFLCTYSIIMVLRKAALKQLPRNKVPNMAVMIKSLTRSTVDASVVFKDPTGEMQGTVHRVLLETHQNELKPGSVLLLKQIGVFSPSLRNHYLNVTPNNLVHIYSPDSGDGNFPKPSHPFSKGPRSFDDSFQPDVTPKPAQNPGVSPEEELPEADDLDGLLSELPEDFFDVPSSWDCPKAGHPP